MEEIGCTVPTSTMECLKQRDAKHVYDKIYKEKMKIGINMAKQYDRKSRIPYKTAKMTKKWLQISGQYCSNW